ncbi:MAG TPA: heme-binding domain-containing protein [Chitinophagaceae bacterium]|jgi:hypothetical protein
MMKKILLFLLLAFVVIQFFHPKRNSSAEPSPNGIAAVYATPDSVQQVLAVACNDCHSGNTRYPWYNSIQPVAWWLNNHVTGGKKELNFDEFRTFTPRRQYNKMKSLVREIKEDGMPLDSYTWIHKDAILSPAQKQLLIDWATGIQRQMEKTYPPDSLARKKPASKN